MDDIEKVIKYIVAIAPGFLALAVCGYLIEWTAPEPHVFVPAALMFSGLVYAIAYYASRAAHAAYWALWQSGQEAPQWSLHVPSFTLLTVVLSLVVGAVFSMLYVSDVFVRLVRGFSNDFDMVAFISKSEPLQLVLSRVSAARPVELDGRPLQKDLKETALIRVRVGDGEYVEGHPMHYPRATDGFIYMSYACFVLSKRSEAASREPPLAPKAGEKNESSKPKSVVPRPPLDYQLINGPGVLVQVKDTSLIEVLDLKTSGCTIEYCKQPTAWKAGGICQGIDTK